MRFLQEILWVTALLVVLAATVGATHIPQTEPDPSLSPLGSAGRGNKCVGSPWQHLHIC